VVEALFPLYLARPDLLPAQWYQGLVNKENNVDLARTVADYISGMTDRFALQEYERLIENGEAQEAKSN